MHFLYDRRTAFLQETDSLTQTLAKLQQEIGLLLDEAQIGQAELQNMVEHLGRQHQRLEKHLIESATGRRPAPKPSLFHAVLRHRHSSRRRIRVLSQMKMIGLLFFFVKVRFQVLTFFREFSSVQWCTQEHYKPRNCRYTVGL